MVATLLLTAWTLILATLSAAVPNYAPSAPISSGPTSAASAAGQSIQLKRRPRSFRSNDEWIVWANTQRDILTAKYRSRLSGRTTGTNL